MEGFFKAVDRAFLYMHDIPSSFTSHMVFGLPVKAMVEIQGVKVLELETPRSRTKTGRETFFNEIAHKTALSELACTKPMQDVHVVILPDPSTMPRGAGRPRVWNPFSDYNSPSRDFMERCMYVHEHCKKMRRPVEEGARFRVSVGDETIFEAPL